jgi:hypothetical protein
VPHVKTKEQYGGQNRDEEVNFGLNAKEKSYPEGDTKSLK